MLTIAQYKAEIAELMKSAGDYKAQATLENRELTKREVSERQAFFEKVEELNGIVANLEREENLSSILRKPDAPRTLENKLPAGTVQVKDKQRFSTFGEQLSAVINASRPGGHADPRLFNVATGTSETVPADGGFLVQQDFSTALLNDVFQTGILASKCRRVAISGNSNGIKINGIDETSRVSSRAGGIVGYWGEEAGTVTATKPKFRQINLELKKLFGLCYATDELMSDSAALESVISTGFASEFGFLIDDAIINGTGAGQPLGILNAGCLVSQAKETGQKAATVIAENVINMYSRLFASSQANAVWLINQMVYPQLFTMSLSVGTGGVPIYMPAGGLSGQPYGTLFGRPVIPIEQAAALGTVGDIILGDFSNGYILAEKGGMQADMSIHIRFLYDENVFRFIMRLDGQPVRASALTPYKGANTQGHFIVLATRA